MNEAKLKRLMRLVEESDIDEIEIKRPFEQVRIIRRRRTEPSAAAEAAAVAAAAPAPVSVPVAAPPAAAVAEPPAAAERDPSLSVIVAPMVGTYYEAPAPGAKPYVTVGDHVSVGQVVCIVEAMKLMNEVQSEISGTVREIRAVNAQAVEYGQELFLVAPA